MQTIAQRFTPIKHYASYLVDGQEVSGTAELLSGSGYLFRKDGEQQAILVSYKDPELLLYGLCELADNPDPKPLWEQIADPGYYEGRDRRGDQARGR